MKDIEVGQRVNVRSATSTRRDAGMPSRPTAPAPVSRPHQFTALSPTALRIIAALTFLTLSRFHDRFSVLAAVRAPLLLSLAALALLLLQPRRWRPRDLLAHGITKGIGIIAIVAVLGVPFGIYPGAALDFLLDSWFRTLIVGVMVWASCRTPQGAELVAKSIASGGLAAALLAVEAGRSDRDGRLMGASMYDPNDLALTCVVALPLSIWWAIRQRGLLRLVPIFTVPVLLWTIVATGSRGGFLGATGVMLGAASMLVLRMAPPVRRASLAAVAVMTVAAATMPSGYRERLATMLQPDQDYNRTSETGRMEIWRRGIGYAVAHPLFGVGINNFPTAEGRLSENSRLRAPGQGFKWSAAHNAFVQGLAELGIIGGSIFFVIVWTTPVILIRESRQHRGASGWTPDQSLAPFLGLSTLGFAISGFFLSVAYYDVLYILLGAGSAVHLRMRRARSQSPVR